MSDFDFAVAFVCVILVVSWLLPMPRRYRDILNEIDRDLQAMKLKETE